MPQPCTKRLPQVLVHIVTFNHRSTIRGCIESVLASVSHDVGISLLVTDNCSTDGTPALLEGLCAGRFNLRLNSENLGFCGAHNQGVATFLEGNYEYLLILNPDIALAPEAISRLVHRLQNSDQRLGVAGAVLFRADGNLRPLEPKRYDSLGIEMRCSLRHLDVASNVQFDERSISQDVFGVTGACLLLRRPAVEASLLPRSDDETLFNLYPQLRSGADRRPQLFDEAFFAYREDADLAWRLRLLGWLACIEPSAEGYHVRHVVPERRSSLAPELNKLGVRNRFLLQLNNFPLTCVRSRAYWRCLVLGFVVRNILVLCAVLLQERTSLRGLREVGMLWRRALANRRWIQTHRTAAYEEVFSWFHNS